jgi:serine phosphatase RsbU (regulator of sigma subunit)
VTEQRVVDGANAVADLSLRGLIIHQPVMVHPAQPVHEVVRLMNERNIGAALVCDGEARLVGIFTERDLLRHAATAPPGWRQRPVSDWMTPNPWSLAPTATWEQTMSLMETLHVRHAPVVEDGHVIGIVSARDMLEHYNEYLQQIVAERTRELREAYQRLQERDAELRLHMTVAGRLQTRLLPVEPPCVTELALATHYEPLDPLGGDYYDFACPDERHFTLLIADASGHSIPAAMVAIMARTAFATAARATTRPSAVLAAMNRYLHGLTGEHFVTAFCAVLNRESLALTCANAGHPFPFRYHHAAGRCEALAARGLMLGVLPESEYEEHGVQLAADDRLLFFTDGVLDCLAENKEPFGAERIEQFLLEHRDQSAGSLARCLADRLAAFRGQTPAYDDITILAAEVL